MALVDLPNYMPMIPWTPGMAIGGTVSVSEGSAAVGVTNAAGDATAIIFQARDTTVPDEISFFVPLVTTAGTTGDIEAELQTVDATTGEPTGTQVTNSNTGTATVSTTGVKTITGIAGTAVVVRGDYYALVLTAGAGWDRDLDIQQTIGTSQGSVSSPYAAESNDGGSTWTKLDGTNSGWNFGLADSSSNYMHIPGLVGPFDVFDSPAFGNATNPNERGNRFIMPMPCTCVGVAISVNLGSTPGTNDDFGVALYSSHTATPVLEASATNPGPVVGGAAAVKYMLFDTAVDLTVGTVYAVTFKAVGSDSSELYRWGYTNTTFLDCLAGPDFYSTTRDGSTGDPAGGGNNFSDDNTEVYVIFPIFSRMDDGANVHVSTVTANIVQGGGVVASGPMP